MRVSDYNKATVNADDDYFVIDGNINGTRSLPASSKVNRSKVIETTLSASNWVGDEKPFTYELSLPEVTEENNVYLVLPGWVKEKEHLNIIEEYQMASILNGDQFVGRIEIVAWENKPTIDLPIVIQITDDAPIGG